MKNLMLFFCLLLSRSVIAQEPAYSWEIQQAEVLPGGDLQWAPHDFVFMAGISMRYIDFDNGDDDNDGLSANTPWKHHPWDANAAGNARNGSGIQTYIFKRGVVYRGVLTARESGENANPIRLTSDPAWGTGEAAIYGSLKTTSGWIKASAAIAPKIPNPDKVWYRDIGLLDNPTKVVCEVTGTGIKRIYLARSPNFINTPDEPMQSWWTFTDKQVGGGYLKLTDAVHFSQTDVDYYKNGDVWAIEDAVVMATLWKKQILNYTPSTKTISVSLEEGQANFGGKDCKYYVENTPYMLDTPGEYFYDKAIGRIFLRLEGDKDPNTTIIEIASESSLINLSSRSNIDISGLTIGFTTYDEVRYGTADAMPAIRLENSSNITVRNCRFIYLNGGIMANGNGKNLTISDSEMNNMDDFSVLLNGPDEVSILRNKISENGTRHLGRWYSSIPAIAGNLKVGEIAGNIIEHTWGSGINISWGKGSGESSTVPFIRGFVHHNKVMHSLQGVNDYGGIESWQGGPVYTYNNISGDAQGWHYNWWVGHIISLGYPFYFDGAFKQYVFNNMVIGTGWNRNSAAYMQVLGFYNMYVHNMAYNVASFTGSGDGNLSPDGQNCYLANVSDSTERQFDHTTRISGIPFESYGNNLFSGNAFKGNFLTSGAEPRYEFTYDEFVSRLNSFNPDLGQVGYETSRRVFTNPAGNDFRPTVTSELIDKGVKFFAPFPLSRVVGEWHFYKHKSDSSLIKGENFYFTNEFINRESYNNVPKNHMKAYGLSAGSFIKGNLEDWTEGALVFDGIQTYCSANNSTTSSKTCNNLDMTTNNFILESYFKTDSGSTGRVIVSKSGSSGFGYQLDEDPSGNARFSILNNGGIEFSQSGSSAINDGNWHHVLVEVNRQIPAVTIYIDGTQANGSSTGTMPSSSVSLTNTGDFQVGKGSIGDFFSGTIDFLRISKGTLADAKTTLGELYKWEFDGPFLRDFAGIKPEGKRDAGPLEKGAKICDMNVSAHELKFGLDGGSQSFTVQAEAGFEIAGTKGTFFSYSVDANTVTVQVQASGQTASGEIAVLGCNETIKVRIIRGNPTAVNNILSGEIKVMPNPVTGNQLTVSVPGDLQVKQARFATLNGEIIFQHALNDGDNLLDINVPQGMYLLHISGPGISYIAKIVVN